MNNFPAVLLLIGCALIFCGVLTAAINRGATRDPPRPLTALEKARQHAMITNGAIRLNYMEPWIREIVRDEIAKEPKP